MYVCTSEISPFPRAGYFSELKEYLTASNRLPSESTGTRGSSLTRPRLVLYLSYLVRSRCLYGNTGVCLVQIMGSGCNLGQSGSAVCRREALLSPSHGWFAACSSKAGWWG